MILQNPFNLDDFTVYISNLLPNFKLDKRPVDVGSTGFKEIIRLGHDSSIETSVFVIRSSTKLNSRISLSNNSFKIMKSYAIYSALIVYVNDDETIWRFSHLTTEITLINGKVVPTYSNPKRHSYILGTEVGLATARKYLEREGKVVNLDDLKRRFSVEVVNKDFYAEIAGHFYKLVGRYGTKKEVLKKPILKLPGKNVKIEDLQNYSVRLIGRIVFLWFLKQKLSQSGKPLLPMELLSINKEDPKNVLHTKMEPIFFEVLNKPLNKRDEKYRKDLYGEVPYLNGGLFHATDGLAGDYYKLAGDNVKVEIPDTWFVDFFQTLNTYNFTMDENLDHDVDLSIDPEMLGRVFENLLAEINPETGEIARKSTGSYYTPRAIVNFMVDESLKQYLSDKTKISDEKLKAVISITREDDLENPLSEDERKHIVNAISKLRVLDPACGSGAFPMGMLQKLLWIVTQVDHDGMEFLESADMEGTEHWLTPSRLDYLRKRKIIRDIIFGTDIQSVAVEIAKLRCFLTLIVDQEIDDSAPNRGVVPLPNLDFKFICADSLSPLDASKQLTFGDDPELENQLSKIRKRYFVTADEERKEKLRKDYENIINQEVLEFGESKRNKQLRSFKPLSSNNQSTFFDLQTMYGFDNFPLIIGNPPYKVLEGEDSQEISKNLKLIPSYKYALGGKLNLYRHFIERSWQMLSKEGILSFIVPSTIIADKNTSGIRRLFRDNGTLKFLIEFPEKEKVFESVTQATAIFLYSNGLKKDDFKLSVGLNKATLPPETHAELSWSEVERLYGNDLYLPLIKSKAELQLIEKLFVDSLPLKSYYRSYQGDLNLSLRKSDISFNPKDYLLIRGEHIDSYQINLEEDKIKPRRIKLNSKELNSHLSSVKNERIAMQGIANMGNIFRLKATKIPRSIVVGHNANVLESIKDKNDLSENMLLALLNSKLLNWYYKKISTNNSINIYELDNLPIKKIQGPSALKIETLVSNLLSLSKKTSLTKAEEVLKIQHLDTINQIIFDLYSLSAEEIDIIQQTLV